MLPADIESVPEDRLGEFDGRTVGMEAGSDRIGIDRIPRVNRFGVVAGLHLKQQPDRNEIEAHCTIVAVLTVLRASYATARSIQRGEEKATCSGQGDS